VYRLDNLELDVSQAVQVLKAEIRYCSTHENAVGIGASLHLRWRQYILSPRSLFFQRDQNKVIRDGDEAAEIQIW
jgi:hypothetical protein